MRDVKYNNISIIINTITWIQKQYGRAMGNIYIPGFWFRGNTMGDKKNITTSRIVYAS